MYRTNVATGAVSMNTIPLAQQIQQIRQFLKVEKSFGKLDLEVGARYDYDGC